MAGLYKGQAYGLRDKAFRQSKTSFNRFVAIAASSDFLCKTWDEE